MSSPSAAEADFGAQSFAGERDCLVVIIADRLSALLEKGEVTPRYYNPGNLFREVHLVLTNDDRPSLAAVQPMVGNARLSIHNVPIDAHFRRTLGFQPFLLRHLVKQVVALADRCRPSLIRCHGAGLNGFLAAEIKKRRSIPYVVSLHINPDVDVYARLTGWKQKLVGWTIRRLERRALRNADLVLPVYRPIEPYLERIGGVRYQVHYNVINPDAIRRKQDYRLHSPARLVCVGRLFREKYPANIIHAVAGLRDATLTVIGDGPCRAELALLAEQLGAADRVDFRPSVPNDDVCRTLQDCDLFVVHSEFYEISKSVLEALLTGLPVIINRRIGAAVPELTGDLCMLVDNSVAGYRRAITALLSDSEMREGLGHRASDRAWSSWSPNRTEAQFVATYRRVMDSNSVRAPSPASAGAV